jgi:UDP-2,3-diacylglucosamine pyrophosphatase LpxH
MNRFANFLLAKVGRPRVALSKLVKERVKTAVAAITNFEQTAADIAADEGYQYVACGHIHQPEIKTLTTEKGPVTYLNSGDWVENLTALEYTDETGWQLYHYHQDLGLPPAAEALPDPTDLAADADAATLLEGLLAEFKLR